MYVYKYVRMFGCTHAFEYVLIRTFVYLLDYLLMCACVGVCALCMFVCMYI